MDELYKTSEKLTRLEDLRFKRGLLDELECNCRLIEVSGARGVGKTTLLLQKVILLNNQNPGEAIYVTLDDPYFFNNTIYDLAEEFLNYGGKYLFLDEVHKYPEKHKGYDWSSELKNIYDKYPELNVVYSGSSVLQLYKGNGDLSRRRVNYHLPGLSFREYLEFNEIIKLPKYSIQDILDNHQAIAKEITSQVKIIPQFTKYLKHGYFPFYNEAPDHYLPRLKEVISVVLESDIPMVVEITYETIAKLKKLLAVVAGSVPYVPNLSKVRGDLYIADQRTLLKYMNYLEKAEMIMLLSKKAKGKQVMRKPDKIYLNNPDLLKCFEERPEIGTVRETFFMNQIQEVADLRYPEKGDFLVDEKYVFEIGGKNKKKDQLKGMKNAYYAIDGIELGFGQTIPLWLFGLLY